MAPAGSILPVFFLIFLASFVKGDPQVHMCSRDSTLQKVYDFPPHTVFGKCREKCLHNHRSSLFGIRRDGPSGRTAGCYCADEASPSGGECSYLCGSSPCGGDHDEALVSVYTVCSDGAFGLDCAQTCHCSDNTFCNLPSGECPSGCDPGWFGPSCDSECPVNCASCNSTGYCESCKPGFYGKTCGGNCETCVSGICDRDNGSCDGACEPGWWGDKCAGECGKCVNGTCFQEGGECHGGCEPGWYGAKCAGECENCTSGTCDQESGDCHGGCEPGWYGPKCAGKCGNCSSGTCDQGTGDCNEEGCTPGWYGAKCNQACPMNCMDHTCHQTTGACDTGCYSGFYGQFCDNPCPVDCKACDQDSGECLEGDGGMLLSVHIWTWMITCLSSFLVAVGPTIKCAF